MPTGRSRWGARRNKRVSNETKDRKMPKCNVRGSESGLVKSRSTRLEYLAA